MILPIVAYGTPALRKPTVEIDRNYEGLNDLIQNMFDTIYAGEGVGLAAPQVGLAIRLFVLDASPYADEYPKLANCKHVFINPIIVKESGEEWWFNEGCLSIPTIREDISRKPNVQIQYYDENFVFHDVNFDGLVARIIQHEYDHLEGVLFVDYLTPIRKRLLKKRLNNISLGNVNAKYKMSFPKIKIK